MSERFVQLENQPKPWRMFKAMLSIGTVCAALLVFVYYTTAPIIKENHRELLQASILKLYPKSHGYKAYTLGETGQAEQEHEDITNADFYHIFDLNQQSLGYVIKASGMGYQDTIQLLYSYKPLEQTLNGYVIVSSRETPGLGTKIEKDKDFLNQFEAIPVTLNNEKTGLLHPIELAKKGKKEHPWQIDSISGATVSSRALVQILSRSTSYWAPRFIQLNKVEQHE